MKKRSHAVLAVTAGLMASLCFLAPQAFADGTFASVSDPAVEASSVSTVAKPQVDAASANEFGTPVASSAESAATAPSSAPVAASASAGARSGASVAEFNGPSTRPLMKRLLSPRILTARPSSSLPMPRLRALIWTRTSPSTAMATR